MTAKIESSALVIASYGQRGILVTSDDSTYRYILKGRRLRAVCGDYVDWEPTEVPGHAVVTAVRNRRNVLERPDSRGRPEPLAANLARIVVVIAPRPTPDFFMVDRYLCAAELLGIAAAIIWNKDDLGQAQPAELEELSRLGYPVIQTSATAGHGIAELQKLLHDGVSLLAGQSGVGKSSLINALVPAADVTTGSLSEATLEGRHTTTAAYMHTVPGGGQLIDTPGVREFAPVIRDLGTVQRGFREIFSHALRCRFSDCQHLREPDCAVKKACDDGEIAERRYASYKRLRNSAAALQEQAGFAGS